MRTTFLAVRRAVAAAVLTVPFLASPAAAATQFALPELTGSFAAGRDVVHLVDSARGDPWAPGNPREPMVSMFYPTADQRGRASPYLTVTEARLFLHAQRVDGIVDAMAFSGARTTAVTAARPRHGRFPMVVLPPGLADHRAADISFLIDRLTASRPAWRHACHVDRRRIGVAGHSIGGNAAATTTASDRRVRAGVPDAGSPLPGTRTAPVARAHVPAFFDQHLRGVPQRLPDGRPRTIPRSSSRRAGDP
ncbi:hypothetical protein [Actinoplanes sp. OR16]|uniref:hypothetical protein n=1 Tax=Actinoplanes sp. OR16 TaxID=946334 RepID=UPI000FDC6848|nr:hypothetical protein [Actinoplanes sp. OR16]